MDLQEFKSKNPEFVNKARECKDTFAFTKLLEFYKIKLGADTFDKAYALFCQPNKGNFSDNSNNSELSDEALAYAAGGVGNGFEAQEINIGGGDPTTIIKF